MSDHSNGNPHGIASDAIDPSEPFGRPTRQIDEGESNPIKNQFSSRCVLSISSPQFVRLLVSSRHTPMADPAMLFPWLHGVAHDNRSALEYFPSQGPPVATQPPQVPGGVVLVACCDVLPHEMELTGALHARDILRKSPDNCDYLGEFLDVDTHSGVKIRNFRAQQVKAAQCCHIVVYLPTLPDESPTQREARAEESFSVAKKLRRAQIKSESICHTFYYSKQLAEALQLLTPTDQNSLMIHPPPVKPNVRRQETAKSKNKRFQTMSGPIKSDFTGPGKVPDGFLKPKPSLQEKAPDFLSKDVSVSDFPLEDGVLDEPSSRDSPQPVESLHGPERLNQWDYNFPNVELELLRDMTASIEIFPNIWLGNSMDASYVTNKNGEREDTTHRQYFSRGIATQNGLEQAMVIDCNLRCHTLPSLEMLDFEITKVTSSQNPLGLLEIEFPGSGLGVWPRINQLQATQIVDMCFLIYLRSMISPVLITCNDGYRASSMLMLIYAIYHEARPLDRSLIYLYRKKRRAFSLSPPDVEVLLMIQNILIEVSPTKEGALPARAYSITQLPPLTSPEPTRPAWLDNFDGSFPSRILPHVFLGGYKHAVNKDMLKALGIRRVISIGECPFDCTKESPSPRKGTQIESHGSDPTFPDAATTDKRSTPTNGDTMSDFKKAERDLSDNALNCQAVNIKDDAEDTTSSEIEFLRISEFQDNGVMGLSDYLEECLEFLRESHELDIPTLVHCQQGVSRSAAICIAEIMRSQEKTLPYAYLATRVRRLDVLIQPNLRFMYDLCRYEERLYRARSMEWPVLCREIALMNEGYGI